jgi:tyrosine-specific transport protein
MNKQLGSIMIIAGTCIGSGMIALPLIMAKIGIVASVVLMLAMWALVYFTSLVCVELNLQAGKGLTLGELGRKFSGKIAEIIGYFSIKLLSICLLAAYIYAGSSIVQTLIGKESSLGFITFIYAMIVGIILLFPIRIIDYINRLMFMILITLAILLIVGLASKISINSLPLSEATTLDINSWCSLLPVVFTSFGFQVIFHTLTNYCNKDSVILKRAFFWGSLIPAFLYILWTISVISVVRHHNYEFYQQIIDGKVEAGELIEQLSSISKFHFIQVCVWWISLLAIFTSVVGVGLGLFQSYYEIISRRMKIEQQNWVAIISSLAVVLIPYLLAVLVPNAFISVLGFAGLILVIIAILLPIYLLYKAKIKNYHYPVLRNQVLVMGSVCAGLIIIIAELWNIWH